MKTSDEGTFPWAAFGKDPNVIFPIHRWSSLLGQKSYDALQAAKLFETLSDSELMGKRQVLDLGEGLEEHEISFQNGKWIACSTETAIAREVALSQISLFRISRARLLNHLAENNGFENFSIPSSESFISIGTRRIRSREIRWVFCPNMAILNDSSSMLYLNHLAGEQNVVVVSGPVSAPCVRYQGLSSRVLFTGAPSEKRNWLLNWEEIASPSAGFRGEDVAQILYERSGKILLLDFEEGAIFLYGVNIDIKNGTEAFKYLKEISGFVDGASVRIEVFAQKHLKNARAKGGSIDSIYDAQKFIRNKIRKAFPAEDPRLQLALNLLESKIEGSVSLPIKKEELFLWKK